MKSIFKKLLILIYPNKCMSCGEIIGENENFCEICKGELNVINPKKRCLKCGNDKKYCQCKSAVYRFVAVVSVYENNDTAKRGFYRYKFGGRIHYGDFFAKEMARTVKEEYKNIKFDLVCPVPTSYKSYMKYGFNHTGYLSDKISKILNIPTDNILKVKENGVSQHNSRFNDRKDNIKGKYTFTKRADNKRVLLVDDIKTSGATLDECARQLLFSGASEVYCVTALSTVLNKDKVEK